MLNYLQKSVLVVIFASSFYGILLGDEIWQTCPPVSGVRSSEQI